MIKVCCDPYRDPYSKGGYNFGDMISLDLLKLLTGQEIQRVPLERVHESDIVCAGSILEYIPEDYEGYIWGTGFMFDKDYDRDAWDNFSLTKNFKHARVLAVRGELTKERITTHRGDKQIELGDPGILCELLKSPDIEVEYELGIVPHYVDKYDDVVMELHDKHKKSLLIDVLDTPVNVINNIARCKNVISSSLHGVIVSESLGIPTEWREFSNKVGGAGFKFRDYQSMKKPYLTQRTDLEERKRKLIEALPAKYETAKYEILNHNAIH